jgi:hypothetical protein
MLAAWTVALGGVSRYIKSDISADGGPPLSQAADYLSDIRRLAAALRSHSSKRPIRS